MFRRIPLSIITSFSLYTQQWYMSHSLRSAKLITMHGHLNVKIGKMYSKHNLLDVFLSIRSSYIANHTISIC